MSEAKHCSDIFLFQKTLKKLRDIDDKIIYALNESTPTKSFQVCFKFYFQLSMKTSLSLQARGVDPTVRCSELELELSQSHQSRAEWSTLIGLIR